MAERVENCRRGEKMIGDLIGAVIVENRGTIADALWRISDRRLRAPRAVTVCSAIATIASWAVARCVGKWPNLEISFGLLGWLCVFLFVASVLFGVYVTLRLRTAVSQRAETNFKA
jgi:hypothetical protein